MTEQEKQELIENFAFTLDADELLNMDEVEYDKRLNEYIALHSKEGQDSSEETDETSEEVEEKEEETSTEGNEEGTDEEESTEDIDENVDDKETHDDNVEKHDSESESVSKHGKGQSSGNRDSNSNDSSSSAPVDYEKVYNEIFAPFKATKKMVQVRSVDEVRSLMQKGVAYVKNNEQMKPFKPMIKIMQEHGFTDPNELAFAIDLVKNKDKGAIKKLLKEANYDAFEESSDEDDNSNNYNPTVQAPSQDAIALDTVLQELEEQDEESFKALIDDVVNPTIWDMEARKVLSQKPNLMRNLFNHVADGTYKIVMDEIAHRKYVGTLEESNTLEAYNRVLHDLHAKYQAEQANGSNQESTQSTNTTNKVDRKKLNKAAPTKGSAPKRQKTQKTDFPNPYSLSPEELDKTYDQVMQTYRR